MMRYNPILFFILTLFSSSPIYAQTEINGNFEALDSKGNPLGWELAKNANTYKITLDSTVKLHGKHSVSIAHRDGSDFGETVLRINRRFPGKTLTLAGFLKIENVSKGFAGLWMRTNDVNGKSVQYDNTEKPAFTGTSDWKEFMVQIPYDGREVGTIEFGAVLAGEGKLWVDSLRLYIDEVAVEKISESKAPVYKALSDTAFNAGSGIDTIRLNPAKLKYLTILGELWGFLKYHHPAIANGDYNWDAELFRVLPEVMKCNTDLQVAQVFEKWVDRLGKVPSCTKCKTIPGKDQIASPPAYGSVFNNNIFSKSLSGKLANILKKSNNTEHYYVGGIIGETRSSFPHEMKYGERSYPDAGQRLLAVYRYRSMIQYFSPNRNLTERWDSILPDFIPEVLQASNENTYTRTLIKMVARIHDSHAFIQSEVFERHSGKYKPGFGTEFIGDQLVVTTSPKQGNDTSGYVMKGDLITAINGKPVDSLIENYLPYTPASNRQAALRDMRNRYLLSSNDSTMTLQILRVDRPLTVVHKTGNKEDIDTTYQNEPHKPAHALISPGIGYIFCGGYKNTQLDTIKMQFGESKGLIIDMRGYPVDEMIESIAAYVKSDNSIFARFSTRSVDRPGTFLFTKPATNGSKTANNYKGQVVVLVNENTQSNAELVTMAMQTGQDVKVIGSSSAGADGNITPIHLPGGFTTWISGFGVYYPDGTNAQRKGVKIDKVVKRTVKGIREGRDELLDEAINLITAK